MWGNTAVGSELSQYVLEFDSNSADDFTIAITVNNGNTRLFTIKKSVALGNGLTVTDNGDGWQHYVYDYSTLMTNYGDNASYYNSGLAQYYMTGLRNYGATNALTIANVEFYNAVYSDVVEITGNGFVNLWGNTAVGSELSQYVLEFDSNSTDDFTLAITVNNGNTRLFTIKKSVALGNGLTVTDNGDGWNHYVYDYSTLMANYGSNSSYYTASLAQYYMTGLRNYGAANTLTIANVEFYKPVKNITLDAIGHGGWNNVDNSFNGVIPEGTTWLLLNFSLPNDDFTPDATNLITDENSLSLGVTLNGKTFYELYQENDQFSINALMGYFQFQIPKTYLVGGNGYALPTIEIAEGTLFKGYSLPQVEMELRDGTWQEPAKYDDLAFMGFLGDDFNNKDFGVPSVFLTFDASDFAPGAQVNPISVSGLKLNGVELPQNKLVLWETNILWIQYTAEDAVANVNGYSHPTITFENATLSNASNTYTFKDLTLYLNLDTQLWQTEKPAGYVVTREASITGIGSNNCTLEGSNYVTDIEFSVDLSGCEASAFDSLVKFNGNSVATVGGTLSIAGNCLKVAIPNTVEIANGATLAVEGGNVNGYIFSASLVYKYFNGYFISDYDIGTPNITLEAIGHGGWNNVDNSYNTAIPEGATWLLLNFSLPNDDFTPDATNLIAEANSLSLSVTLNGKTFYELYQENDQFAINTFMGYFQFQIPKTYLVGGNGYELPTIEIAEGTPFKGQYLPQVNMELRDGIWQAPAKYDDLAFTGFLGDDFNNKDFGVPSVFLTFDASDFAPGAQVNPISVSGLKLNGVELPQNKLVLWETNILWIQYTAEDAVANVNGYSHPTITFENATVSNATHTYTFNDLTIYLNLDTQLWQTEKPANYSHTYPQLQLNANVGSGVLGLEWNNFDYNGYANIPENNEPNTGTPANGSCGLISFTTNITGNIITANMANESTAIGLNFKVNGVSIKDIPGAYISCPASANYIYFYLPNAGLQANGIDISWYTITIDEGTQFLSFALPSITYYFYDHLFHIEPAVDLTVNYAGEFVKQRLNGQTSIDAEYLGDILAREFANLKVFKWAIDGTDYVVGQIVVISGNENVTINITEAVEFYTEDGASIRMSDTDDRTAMRFSSIISNDSYNALVAAYGEGNVITGTFIAPKKYIDEYLALDPLNSLRTYFAQGAGEPSNPKYADLVNINSNGEIGMLNRTTYLTDNYIKFAGSIDVALSNYNSEFFGVGYIKIIDNGTEYYIFGSNELLQNTRTIYYVAASAYNDTSVSYTEANLRNLAKYLDSVINVTYKGGNLSITPEITGRDYMPAYQVSTDDDAVYIIVNEANKKVANYMIVNGQRIKIADNFNFESTESGQLIITASKTTMDELFKTVSYGIGEPCRDVWTTTGNAGHPYSDAEMIAEIVGNGGFNATAYRVWMNSEIASAGAGNVVTLNSSNVAELKVLVELLVSKGVNEIYFSTTLIPSYTQKRIYAQNQTTGDFEWISSETYNAGGYAQLLYKEVSAVPNFDNGEEEEYAKWLKVQYDMYDLLTKEVAGWVNEHSWGTTVKFIFEGINEPEGQTNIHRLGVYKVDVGYSYNYFDNDSLAKVLTDLSYYCTKAVNANLTNIGKVSTVALTSVWKDSNSAGFASGVYSNTLLAAMTAAIQDEVAPTAIDGVTPSNSQDANDYYTVLNWHPYISWWKDENSYLYYGYSTTSKNWLGISKTTYSVNANYVQEWIDWNLAMYNLATNGFVNYHPDVVFSELGAFDYGANATDDKYTKLGINEAGAANLLKTLINAASTIDFGSGSLTIIAFRLCDMETQLVNEGGHGTLENPDFFAMAEGNVGLIEEDGTLKKTGEELYFIINGNYNTDALQDKITENWN